MGTPQIIFLVLTGIGLLITANEHGKARKPTNFWSSLLSTAIIFALLIWGGFFYHEKEPKILTADEYCISQGYDKAGEKDGVGNYKRVKCLSGETSFMWYQYPPKTDLENYCQGNL
jgi:hypothetical protein